MRKSLWSPDEDEKLKRYVAQHGYGSWSDVARHTGLKRCGKSCRLRWVNYLRPDLKRGPFLADEIRVVVDLHREVGNSWSKIASYLPGRTDNDVKNFWHSYTRSRRGEQCISKSVSITKNSDRRSTIFHDKHALMNINHDYNNSNSGGCTSTITELRSIINSFSPNDFSDSSIGKNFSFAEQHRSSGGMQNDTSSLIMKVNTNRPIDISSMHYDYTADYELLLATFGNADNNNLLQALACSGESSHKLLPPPEGLHCVIRDFLNHHQEAASQLISNQPPLISLHNQHDVTDFPGSNPDIGLSKDLEQDQIAKFDDLVGVHLSFQTLQSPGPIDIARFKQWTN